MVSGGSFSNTYDFVLYPSIGDRLVAFTGSLVNPTITFWGAVYPIPGGSATLYFAHDNVVLNYGLFTNQRLYNENQLANAIPFPAPRPTFRHNMWG